MNNPSPLVPQGSLVEQKNKGRARVKIAVFFVLAIHGIGLLALLLQGCQRDHGATADAGATNTAVVFDPTNNAPVDPNGSNPAAAAAAAATSNTTGTASAGGPPATVTTTTTTETQPGTTPPAAASEYTIAKGDTLGAIAKNFHVTVKSIMEANPGIEPTRLKPNQKVHIPAAVAATASVGTAKPGASTDASGAAIYAVKSGDTLTTIARHEGTTLKELRTANNLKTDSIRVGQKLKIPSRGNAASGAYSPTPVSPASAADAPVVTATNVGGNR